MHGSHDSSSSSSNKLQALEVAILVLLAFLSSSPSSSSWVRAATLGEVGQHATPEDCWSAVYGNVYDLTGYAPNHRRGGGPSAVYKMCGIDGTDLFDDYHSDNKVRFLSLLLFLRCKNESLPAFSWRSTNLSKNSHSHYQFLEYLIFQYATGVAGRNQQYSKPWSFDRRRD